MTATVSPSDWLSKHAQRTPDRPALTYKGRTWTYASLYADTCRFAFGLRSLGVSKGAYVGVISVNSPDQVFLYHALILLGAVIIPVKNHLKTDEHQTILNNLPLDKLILSDAKNVDAKDFQILDPVYISDIKQFERSDINRSSDNDLHDPCALFLTSGTTGTPKAVQLSYQNFFYGAISSGINLEIKHDDNWLACLPLDHIGGFSIILRSLIYGTTVTLHQRFEEPEISEEFNHSHISHISLVPTMLQRLVEYEVAPPASLRAALLGGAPAPKHLVRSALDAGWPIVQTYGLTEACSQVTTTPLSEIGLKPGSSGKPLPFTTVKIVDSGANELKPGETGEIFVKGPTVMQRYFRDQEATRKAIKKGWLHTGDYGYLDEANNLFTVSRREDLILTGGENVYPVEVESGLLSHPAVKDAVVLGIDDRKWGQRVVAAVVLNEAKTNQIPQIREYLKNRLASYKCPKDYASLEEIPRTTSGKPDRNRLREIIEEHRS